MNGKIPKSWLSGFTFDLCPLLTFIVILKCVFPINTQNALNKMHNSCALPPNY